MRIQTPGGRDPGATLKLVCLSPHLSSLRDLTVELRSNGSKLFRTINEGRYFIFTHILTHPNIKTK